MTTLEPRRSVAAPDTAGGDRLTERDMLNALRQRYTQQRRGTIADRYVRAEHVRSTQNFYREFISVADYIAIDKYASSQSIHGHEIKVSRSDWLAEVKNPDKAQRIARYCHYFWLVVPDASIVAEGELPASWGLLVLGSRGLRARVQAPRTEPEPLTLDFVAGLAAAVARTAAREPLYADAPVAWGPHSERLCHACGQPAPCPLHQPRAFDPVRDGHSTLLRA